MERAVSFVVLLLCIEVVRGLAENKTFIPDGMVGRKLIVASNGPLRMPDSLVRPEVDLQNKTGSGQSVHVSVPSSVVSNATDHLTVPITIHKNSDNSVIGRFELTIRNSVKDSSGIDTSSPYVPYVWNPDSEFCLPWISSYNSSHICELPRGNNTLPCANNQTFPSLRWTSKTTKAPSNNSTIKPAKRIRIQRILLKNYIQPSFLYPLVDYSVNLTGALPMNPWTTNDSSFAGLNQPVLFESMW